MDALFTASDDVFDSRIAEMLTHDDHPVYDAKPDTAHWKKLRLRLDINTSGLKDCLRSDN